MRSIVILSLEAATRETFPYRYAHICILDPNQSIGAPPLSVDPNRVATLRLIFWDQRDQVEADLYHQPLPTAADVAEVVPFVRRWMLEVEGFVVNCFAGRSRSAGCAAGISSLLGLDEAVCYLPQYNPNPVVRDLIKASILN